MKGQPERSAASLNTSAKRFLLLSEVRLQQEPVLRVLEQPPDAPAPSPHHEDVDLLALAGVHLKFFEEGVEERDHQVHQRHNEGNQERLSLLERSPAGLICRVL